MLPRVPPRVPRCGSVTRCVRRREPGKEPKRDWVLHSVSEREPRLPWELVTV